MSVGVVGWKILSAGAQGAMAAGAVAILKGHDFFALHDAFQADVMVQKPLWLPIWSLKGAAS